MTTITPTGLPTASDANTAHNAHLYPHRGTARLYHLSGHNSLSLSQPPTIDPRRQTTTRVLTPRLGGVHEPQHTKSTQFIPHQYRLHNRLPVTQRALHEADSPHLLAGYQTLLHQHTEPHTGHRDRISGFMNLQTLSALIPYKVYISQRGSTTLPPRLNTH